MADRAEAQALADRLMGKSIQPNAFDTVMKGARSRASEDFEIDDDLDDVGELDEVDDEEDDDGGPIDATDADKIIGDGVSPKRGNDEEEDEEEGDDGPDEGVDYGDDLDGSTIVELVVDGETKQVSLSELIQNYSGEGAIDKRLKEATEMRKEAEALRAAVVNEVEEKRSNLLQTVMQLDAVLFEPLVNKPDAKLRARNMNQYLMEQDAYEEDQKRIKEGREQLQEAISQQTQARAKARHDFRLSEHQKLVDKVPEFKDPKKGPALQKQIMNAAAYYGFTPEQVDEVDLHGIFLMALDASRWIKLQQSKNNGKVPNPSEGKPRIRKLRGGGASQAKANAHRSAKEKQVAAKKARQTGSVNDVTSMLLAGVKSGSQKGSRRGRRS